jgi:hypothetical protein
MNNRAASQLRPLSAGEVLDASFQLMRAHFWSLFIRVLAIQLPFAMFRLYGSAVQNNHIFWERLLMMRPEVLSTSVELTLNGMPLPLIIQVSGVDFALFLVGQLVLMAILLPFTAQIYLHRTGAFKPPRLGSPLDFLTLIPASILALSASICSS